MSESLVILPWPPSVNRYWRNVGGRTLISRDGRQYRKTVCGMLAFLPIDSHGDGRLSVEIIAHPPDRRRHDLDNLLKAPLDVLCHAGVYDDDSQIDELSISRGGVVRNGEIVIKIRVIVKNK